MENTPQKSNLFETLKNHFNSTGWPLDLNEQKLDQRSRISSCLTENDCPIVEIEKHRAILGDCYIKGLPMNAYKTYFMRYSINPSTLEVKELPEKCSQYSINASKLAEIHLNSELFDLRVEVKDDDYCISESVSGESKDISTYQEAEEFVLNFIEPNSNFLKDLLYEMELNSVEKQKYLSKYNESIRETLIKKAQIAWEEKEDWE